MIKDILCNMFNLVKEEDAWKELEKVYKQLEEQYKKYCNLKDRYDTLEKEYKHLRNLYDKANDPNKWYLEYTNKLSLITSLYIKDRYETLNK